MLEHLTPRWLCVCELLYQSKSTHGATAGNWSSLWGTMCIVHLVGARLRTPSNQFTLHIVQVIVHVHHRRPALQVVGFVSTGRNWTSMWGTTQNSLKSICNVQFSTIQDVQGHLINCNHGQMVVSSWNQTKSWISEIHKTMSWALSWILSNNYLSPFFQPENIFVCSASHTKESVKRIVICDKSSPY